MAIQQWKSNLTEVKKLTHDVREVAFSIVEPSGFSFLAGQYIAFRVEDKTRGKQVSRLYSICSAPHEENIVRVVYNYVGGPGTLFLENLTVGAEVEFKGPFGKFILQDNDKEAVFVATGTGIGPFRSMLYDNLSKSLRKITLLWGVRHLKDLYYQDEFAELAKKFPNFNFHMCVSQPEGEWSDFAGRVTALFPQLFSSSSNIEVYACGNDAMIKDVKELCVQVGDCPFYREVYF